MPSRRLFSSLFPLLLSLGCGGTTGGALVALPFSVGGVQGPLTFTTPCMDSPPPAPPQTCNSGGWTVTLQTAQIWLGPFYFNALPPVTNQFRGGVVLIEATEQVFVNALDPSSTHVPGGADGETGSAVAVEIDLFPPGASPGNTPGCSFLTQQLGTVAGTATKGATAVAFSGPIAIPNTASVAVPCLELESIPGAAVNPAGVLVFTTAPQTLELTVDPTHWFDLVDFAQLLQGTATGGVYTWTAQSGFMAELIQGVKSGNGVYTFGLSPQ